METELMVSGSKRPQFCIKKTLHYSVKYAGSFKLKILFRKGFV